MPSEADAAASFATHAHYIDAFSQLAGFAMPNTWNSGLQGVLAGIDSFLGTSPLQNTKWVGDAGQVERSLRNAWSTEVLLLQQLDLVEQANELARIVATWAIIQTYYTGYHSTQALIVARGRPRPKEHPKTQSQFVAEWANRKGTLDPWTMAFGASGHGRCQATIDDSVSNLAYATPLTAHSLAAKALKTTWGQHANDRLATRRLTKHEDERKAFRAKQDERVASGKTPLMEPQRLRTKGQSRLTRAETHAVVSGTADVGLLHYLYRLRIKANYVDADTFVEAPETDMDVVRFVRDLTYLAAAMNVAHEHRVRHVIGIDRVEAMRDRWSAGPGKALPSTGTAADYRSV